MVCGNWPQGLSQGCHKMTSGCTRHKIFPVLLLLEKLLDIIVKDFLDKNVFFDKNAFKMHGDIFLNF